MTGKDTQGGVARGVVALMSVHVLLSAMTYLAAKRGVVELPPMTLLMWRLLVSASTFGVLLLFLPAPRLPPRGMLRRVLLLGLLSGPLNQALFLLAMQNTSAAHGALIFSLTPLGVYLVELLEGRERPHWTASLGIGTALVGVVLLLLAHGLRALSGLFFGDVLLLGSLLAWVFYTTEGRELVAAAGPLRTSAWSNIAGAVLLLPLAPWALRPELVGASSLMAKGCVLYLGLGSSVLSYLIWFAALARTDASKVAVFSNLQPVATALAAWALLGEHIGWEVVVGGTLVLLGVRLTQASSSRHSPRPPWGLSMGHPMHFGLWKRESLKTFLKSLWARYLEVSLADAAAQLAFSLLFSTFSFLFFLVTLAAYLPLEPAVKALMRGMHNVLPPEVAQVLEGHLHQLIREPRPHLLGLGLIGAVWSASRGVDAMRVTLNRAYHVTERRKWWRAQLNSIGVTLAATLLIVVGLVAVVMGGRFGVWLFDWFGLQTEFLVFWGWLRWPTTAVMVMGAMALANARLPDIDAPFHLVTPGSIVGAVVWVAVTWGVGLVTANVERLDVAYGSLASVMVLLSWFYLSGFAFLLGGLVNAVLAPEPPERAPKPVAPPLASPESALGPQ